MRVLKRLIPALMVVVSTTLGAAEKPGGGAGPRGANEPSKPTPSPNPTPTPTPSPAAPSGGPFAALKYRYIGPEGNRVSAVAGVPGDPSVYYAGAASGGIFKTTDGGVHWEPIFDDQPVSSIGALAVAPSDPNVVWA